MQAIILAAGTGKRLKDLTKDHAKCMVEVNGITIIERALRILDKRCLSRIIIVIGYKGRNLIDYIDTLNIATPISYINNPVYDKTNNIYSLMSAEEYLCMEDTLLLESDLIFEEKVIGALLDDDRPNLALVDKFESWMDGTCMELDDEDCITNFISGKHLKFADKEKYYKTVNMYKFSRSFSANTYVPFLTAYMKSVGENEYYESVMKLIALLESKEIRAKRLTGQVWYEIDNIQDLNIAESIFTHSDEEHYQKIAGRYGGYWRYPRLLDFCCLVNPYYPPAKMKEEMKSNFDILLTQYPSGMAVNSLLAADAFDVEPSQIVVGSGAFQLLELLMEKIFRFSDKKIGCICPGPVIEKYLNRHDQSRTEVYRPNREDFAYSEQDLIRFYENKPIGALILVNPDNLSGNYIGYEGCISLIKWCKNRGIYLILDESFADFADIDQGATKPAALLGKSMSGIYDRLYIIKDISYPYGIPGAGLGVLASSDEDLIVDLKKDAVNCTMNSFSEFFLQIKEKYDKDYMESLAKIRKSRQHFINSLTKIPYLKVFPSQTNCVMCELLGVKSYDLCCRLLKQNILIVDMTPEIQNGKQYVRIAVRSESDNVFLTEILKKIYL